MAQLGLESWASSTFSLFSTSANHTSRLRTVQDSIDDGSTLYLLEKSHPSHAPSKLKGRWRRLFHVIIFFIIVFIGACLFSCVAPFYPTKALDKGISLPVIGAIMASMAIVGFFVSWLLAFVGLRVGTKFLMCAGMFITGVNAILFGVIDFSPSGATFAVLSFVLRTFEGIGIAMYMNSAYTMSAIFFADDYAFVMGLLETSTSLGTLLGPSIGGALYAAGGYFMPFIILGGALLLLNPFAIVIVPGNITDNIDFNSEEHNPWRVVKKMFSPAMLIVAYTMLTTTISWVFTETTLGVRLQSFGITDPLVVGLIYLSSSGAYAVTAPITGRLADRYDVAWLIILLGTVLIVFGYLVIGPSPLVLAQLIPAGLPQLIIGCLCTHSGLAAVIVPTTKELQRQAEVNGLDPNSISTLAFITSLFQSIWFLGGFIGSVVSSSLMEFLGFGWATTIQAGIVLTSVGLQLYTVFSQGIARDILAKLKGYESLDESGIADQSPSTFRSSDDDSRGLRFTASNYAQSC